MRLTWAVVAVLVGGAGAAVAEERSRPWMVAVEPAWGRIHGGDTAPAGALRAFRALDGRGRFRAQVGLFASTYGALDVGVEARICPACRVSPVIGLGGGLMAEEDYGGTFGRATAGVEAKLTPAFTLRVTVQAGTHDGQAGPHLGALSLGWRF